MVKIIVEVEEPPDKNSEVETFDSDKYKFVRGEFVAGTRRVKRFTIRTKVNT